MARRFDQYRLRNGDDIGNPGTLNRRFDDLDLRLHSQEVIEKTWAQALSELQGVGLSRLDEVLAPVFNSLRDIANLGAMFTAHSATEIEISPGLKRLVIDVADRDRFAPAAFVAAFVDGDLGKAVMGRVESYDRASGELELQVDRVAGSGTGATWVIHAASATDHVEAAERAETAAADAEASASIAVAASDASTSARDGAVAARDVAVTASTVATAERTAAETARNGAQAAAASMSQVYLGAFATDPATDLNGNALLTGASYYNTAVGQLRTYAGGGWTAAVVPVGSEVFTVFGRTGSVVALDGDYSANKIVVTPAGSITATRVQAALEQLDTLKAPATRAIAAGTGLTGGGSLAADRTLAFDAAWGDARYALAGHGHTFASLTGKPTTLAGYGITNAYTKTEVDQRVADLIAAAPAALDTLTELAAALGNDPNFAASVTTQLGQKLNATALSAWALVFVASASASAARGALGLGSAALESTATFANATHAHDDRYYTEGEVDGLIAGRAPLASLAAKLDVTAKATTEQAQAGTDDAGYMTALKSTQAIAAALPSTALGKSVLNAANAAAARAAIGAQPAGVYVSGVSVPAPTGSGPYVSGMTATIDGAGVLTLQLHRPVGEGGGA